MSRPGYVSNVPLLQGQNDHDAFVDLEAALEIVVRSRKPKAVELTKWLTRKGVEKVVKDRQKAIEEKQKAIDEKDMQIALLDDDLTESQDHRQTAGIQRIPAMQGEIRAKDQEIARRQLEITRVEREIRRSLSRSGQRQSRGNHPEAHLRARRQTL